ncbi:unnamed protein product [Ceratitis capitata]|uniref:(Mediterranean fruit fly) hypothetical protein n=1 Tax=Ceratitis capitata TaxID=7213 RepID=A0A811U3V2_CERCA|nr:unnamed protein product [Ceratitis capitata]
MYVCKNLCTTRFKAYLRAIALLPLLFLFLFSSFFSAQCHNFKKRPISNSASVDGSCGSNATQLSISIELPKINKPNQTKTKYMEIHKLDVAYGLRKKKKQKISLKTITNTLAKAK